MKHCQKCSEKLQLLHFDVLFLIHVCRLFDDGACVSQRIMDFLDSLEVCDEQSLHVEFSNLKTPSKFIIQCGRRATNWDFFRQITKIPNLFTNLLRLLIKNVNRSHFLMQASEKFWHTCSVGPEKFVKNYCWTVIVVKHCWKQMNRYKKITSFVLLK